MASSVVVVGGGSEVAVAEASASVLGAESAGMVSGGVGSGGARVGSCAVASVPVLGWTPVVELGEDVAAEVSVDVGMGAVELDVSVDGVVGPAASLASGSIELGEEFSLAQATRISCSRPEAKKRALRLGARGAGSGGAASSSTMLLDAGSRPNDHDGVRLATNR